MKTNKLLKTLNTYISIVILVLAGYIVLRPFIPEILFDINANKKLQVYTYQTDNLVGSVSDNSVAVIPAVPVSPIPLDNRIIIPRINVDAAITEGTDTSVMENGMWRRPNTSTPDKGGNTVITGHRVLRTSGPDTFYFLNKLQNGDQVVIFWKGKEYIYSVYSVDVVSPYQLDIEDNTKESIITLYTCTPAWTSQMRLVVKAKLQ